MKQVFGALRFTSAVIATISLNLSPVLAQVNSTDNSTNSQINLNSAEEKDIFDNINYELNIPAIDIDTLNQKYSQRQIDLVQVPGVEQLQDVSPQHWAYQALRSLVEKYRCISTSGGEFNGNRPMTRYEFAAAFNACLITIEGLIANSSNSLLKLEDLTVLDRLQREFVTELGEVRNRVDNLESQVTSIEKNQFSTTATLKGSVDFYLISAFGDVRAAAPGDNQRESLDNNLSFSSRAVLDFDTSFTGKDLLRTSIQAGNVSSFDRSSVGTDMISLIGATNSDNKFDLASLY